jgi:hypothetical protein
MVKFSLPDRWIVGVTIYTSLRRKQKREHEQKPRSENIVNDKKTR